MLLHWIYSGIVFILTVLVVVQMFSERRWRDQVALALLLIPLLLRLFHIK